MLGWMQSYRQGNDYGQRWASAKPSDCPEHLSDMMRELTLDLMHSGSDGPDNPRTRPRASIRKFAVDGCTPLPYVSEWFIMMHFVQYAELIEGAKGRRSCEWPRSRARPCID